MSGFITTSPNKIISTSFSQSISTLAELPLVETSGLRDGALIYVNDVDDIYTLELIDSLTPDGVTVISALRGGYWVSREEGRWDDQQGDISQGVGGGSLTYEDFKDTPWKLYCMRHDQDDELNFRFQFSHTWRYDLPVVPHLHILPLADPLSTQIAYFDAYYAWSRPDYPANPVPSMSGWTWKEIQVQIDPGDIDIQTLVSLGPVTPPSWARGSTIMMIYMRRRGTDSTDTYTTSKAYGLPQANVGLLSADVHYRKMDSGSITEIPT